MVGILKGVLIKTPVVPGTSTTVVGLTVDSTRLADAPPKKMGAICCSPKYNGSHTLVRIVPVQYSISVR